MRTTLTLDNDVADQSKRLAAKLGKPFKQVVNEAMRIGLQHLQRPKKVKPYNYKPHNMGPAKIDLDNIAEVIEQIEGPSWR